VTRLRQMMLEELERRNYAPRTIETYIHAVKHFAQHFRCSPDQLGPEHIREYQAALFKSAEVLFAITFHLHAAVGYPLFCR